MSYIQLFSNQIFQLKSVDSTNNYIAKLVKEVELAEGTVVVSSCQTSGKGQKGNGWYSEPGKNLLFSLLLKPSFLGTSHRFFLNMIVCLTIKDVLIHLGLKDVKIKWPNDIMLNNRKVSGVLIENSLFKNTISQSIVGVGLNVNEELITNPMLKAISVFDNTKKVHDLNVILEKFKFFLSKWYFVLQQKKFVDLKKHYLDSLFFFNEFRDFLILENGEFTLQHYKIIDVDDEGCLVLENKKKQLKKVALKEIKFVY